MAKMKAAMAAVLVMEKEGVTQAFGVPGAAINPLYAQLRERQVVRVSRGPIGRIALRQGLIRISACPPGQRFC